MKLIRYWSQASWAPIDETQTKHFCQPVPKQSGEGEREKRERLPQSFWRYTQTQKTKVNAIKT